MFRFSVTGTGIVRMGASEDTLHEQNESMFIILATFWNDDLVTSSLSPL